MGHSTRGTSKRVGSMARGPTSGATGAATQGGGTITTSTVTGSMCGLTVAVSRGAGRTTNSMARGCMCGPMAESTMATTSTIRRKALEYTTGQMGNAMKVFGRTGSSTERARSLTVKESLGRGSGKMETVSNGSTGANETGARTTRLCRTAYIALRMKA